MLRNVLKTVSGAEGTERVVNDNVNDELKARFNKSTATVVTPKSNLACNLMIGAATLAVVLLAYAASQSQVQSRG